jgi:anti-sigma factor RsiW
VKDDHDEDIGCARFKELLDDFIEDELIENERGAFFAHAAACPPCQKEMREIRRLREVLTGLPRAEVSPEFDFRLKSSIRLESIRLRSPVYRARLFFQDNWVSIMSVPMAGALILAGYLTLGIPGLMRFPANEARTMKTESIAPAAFAPSESLSADVHYVLESAELNEEGVKTLAPGLSRGLAPSVHTVAILSL